jgi:hypothetical protein
MRTVQQTIRKAVLLVRRRIVQDPRLQAGHGVDQGQRRQLAPRQDVIAQADFFVHMGINESLVNPLVAAAHQHGTRPFGQLLHTLTASGVCPPG